MALTTLVLEEHVHVHAGKRTNVVVGVPGLQLDSLGAVAEQATKNHRCGPAA